ncbi:MAG: hypothetical protein V3R94_04605 [Acidobacteriota bacterium]
MTMDCDQVPLIELLGGELESRPTEQALVHVEGCPTCQERLHTMAAVKALYGQGVSRKPDRWSFRRPLAASLLIALLIPTLYLIRQSSGIKEENLARLATTDKHPHFPLQTRADLSEPSEESRRRSFAAYDANRFREASDGFGRLPASAEVLFYSGVTHYMLGEYSPALEKLGRAVELDRQWKSAAGWYEANIYLKTDQKQRAEARLRELVSQGSGVYDTRALQILQNLARRE